MLGSRSIESLLKPRESAYPVSCRFLRAQLERRGGLASRAAMAARLERRGDRLFEVSERVLRDMIALFPRYSGRAIAEGDLPAMILAFEELFGSMPHGDAFSDFDQVAERFYDQPFYPLVEHAMYLTDVGLDRLAEVLALAAHVPLEPAGILCDLGVGPGELFSQLLLHFSSWRGRAFDVSQPSVGYATELLKRRKLGGRRAKVERADARKLPVEAGSFQLVVATEIIEHVPDPGVLLEEIARVLVPGGLLIASTPIRLPWGPHLSVFNDEAEVRALFAPRFLVRELVLRPFGAAELSFGLFEARRGVK